MGREDSPTVFFDGVCSLCNAFVDWLVRRDRRGVLKLGPLQGTTAARLIPGLVGPGDPDSVVLVDGAGIHERSTAVLRILMHLGGAWRLAAVGFLVPRPVRDAMYRFVARHRYRWFGRRQTCRLPTPEERSRFVD